MCRQTAADALIDAGRDVAAAVGAERDRHTPTENADPAGTVVVVTLLVLAVAEVPILVVALVGYVVTAARDPETRVSGFDDWTVVGVTGARGTALLGGAALPVVAALLGSGVLEVEAGSVALGPTPGPVLATGIGVLAAATWHAAVVGITGIAAGDRVIANGARVGRSAAGLRLSAAVGGLTGVVAVVGFGLTAIPVVGPVLAAGVGAAGVVVAGRLVGQVVAASDLRGGPVGPGASADRPAAPPDGRRRARGGGSGGLASGVRTE